MNKRIIHLIQHDQPEQKLSQSVNGVRTHTCQEDTQHMASNAHNVTRQTTLRNYAEVKSRQTHRDDNR